MMKVKLCSLKVKSFNLVEISPKQKSKQTKKEKGSKDGPKKDSKKKKDKKGKGNEESKEESEEKPVSTLLFSNFSDLDMTLIIQILKTLFEVDKLTVERELAKADSGEEGFTIKVLVNKENITVKALKYKQGKYTEKTENIFKKDIESILNKYKRVIDEGKIIFAFSSTNQQVFDLSLFSSQQFDEAEKLIKEIKSDYHKDASKLELQLPFLKGVSETTDTMVPLLEGSSFSLRQLALAKWQTEIKFSHKNNSLTFSSKSGLHVLCFEACQ